MNVVNAFWGLMLLIVLGLWVQENWKLGTLVRDHAVHFAGMCWIAMMRHTGNPRYTHQPRRHR